MDRSSRHPPASRRSTPRAPASREEPFPSPPAAAASASSSSSSGGGGAAAAGGLTKKVRKRRNPTENAASALAAKMNLRTLPRHLLDTAQTLLRQARCAFDAPLMRRGQRGVDADRGLEGGDRPTRTWGRRRGRRRGRRGRRRDAVEDEVRLAAHGCLALRRRHTEGRPRRSVRVVPLARSMGGRQLPAVLGGAPVAQLLPPRQEVAARSRRRQERRRRFRRQRRRIGWQGAVDWRGPVHRAPWTHTAHRLVHS